MNQEIRKTGKMQRVCRILSELPTKTESKETASETDALQFLESIAEMIKNIARQ